MENERTAFHQWDRFGKSRRPARGPDGTPNSSRAKLVTLDYDAQNPGTIKEGGKGPVRSAYLRRAGC